MIQDKYDLIESEDKKVVVEVFLNNFLKNLHDEVKQKDYPKSQINKLRVIGLFTHTMIELNLQNKNFSKEFLKEIMI